MPPIAPPGTHAGDGVDDAGVDAGGTPVRIDVYDEDGAGSDGAGSDGGLDTSFFVAEDDDDEQVTANAGATGEQVAANAGATGEQGTGADTFPTIA